MRAELWCATFVALHLAAGGAFAAPLAPAGGGAAPFVIGAPGRSDDADDRREARRYDRADSAVAAYADIEAVGDATWLVQEVESYARRAVAVCGAPGAPSCRRERRTINGAHVLYVAAGGRAELLWVAGHRAVRLGWRRIVEAPTGTMTVEAPPQRFVEALLAEFPSALPAKSLGDDAWVAAEADRRGYYAQRGGVPWCSADQDAAATSDHAP